MGNIHKGSVKSSGNDHKIDSMLAEKILILRRLYNTYEGSVKLTGVLSEMLAVPQMVMS